MSTVDVLDDIARSLRELTTRFVKSGSSGYFLQTADEARFKRLVVEATTAIGEALGQKNAFSANIVHAVNIGSDCFIGGPSLAATHEVAELIEGAAAHIRRHPARPSSTQSAKLGHFVDPSRLSELRLVQAKAFDLQKLIRLCEELNIAYAEGCLMATAMLVRGIVDHVPPIFSASSFGEVANNYAGAQSFKGSMLHLNGSLRKIADAHIHVQIRKTESLPSPTQVDFRADLDVLLAEICRVLR